MGRDHNIKIQFRCNFDGLTSNWETQICVFRTKVISRVPVVLKIFTLNPFLQHEKGRQKRNLAHVGNKFCDFLT